MCCCCNTTLENSTRFDTDTRGPGAVWNQAQGKQQQSDDWGGGGEIVHLALQSHSKMRRSSLMILKAPYNRRQQLNRHYPVDSAVDADVTSELKCVSLALQFFS